MKKGYCHICQKYTDLTFEHIPPNKAFNNISAKSIEGDEIFKMFGTNDRMPWDLNGLQYVSKQRGMGMHSLCKKCNNLTGKYYGNEYIKFANTIDLLLPEILNSKKDVVGINISGIKPLEFAKQVLSMFCSTCPNITKKYPEIIDLLLNPEKKGLDTNKIRLSMFILPQRKISYTGFQAMHITNIGIRLLATIDAYPFGFILEFNPKIKINELDITSFFNDYDYGVECDMEFGIPVLERNNIISCDYRTKEEIIKCINDNNHETNINRLKVKLFKCYSKELCYPKVANNWNEKNKYYGMCAITSLIVNDYHGGDICKIHVDNISHYFNLINNEIVDLTSKQFNKDIDYSNYEIINREEMIANEDTLRRYNLLKDRLNK